MKQRVALYGLATVMPLISDDSAVSRASTYRVGVAFSGAVGSLARGASAIAAACAARTAALGATADDVRRLFDLAGPVLRAGLGVPDNWQDELDVLVGRDA